MSRIKAEVHTYEDFEEASGDKFVRIYVAYTYDDKFISYKGHNINLSNLKEYESVEDKIKAIIEREKKLMLPLLSRGYELQDIVGKEF